MRVQYWHIFKTKGEPMKYHSKNFIDKLESPKSASKHSKNKRWKLFAFVLLFTLSIFLLTKESEPSLPFDPLYDSIEQDPSYRKNGIFYIYSADDFFRFSGYLRRDCEGKSRPYLKEEIPSIYTNVILMKDINLNDSSYLKRWRQSYEDTGIPYPYNVRYLKSYAGIFDGNGHTITIQEKAWSSHGLFHIVEREGVIRNLNVTVAHLTSGEEETLGILCDWNLGRIENCETDGYAEGSYSIGGIAGVNSGTIQNCVNYATIVCTGINFAGAGGIAGEHIAGYEHWENWKEPAVSALITGCTNYGKIKGTWIAGGICSYGGCNGGETKIQDCRNKGDVKVCYSSMNSIPGYEDTYRYAHAGGICARPENRVVITSCANYGTITIEEGTSKKGTFGIGEYEASLSTYIQNCVSLAGTASRKMRHENIMELTLDELWLWEQNPDTFSYVPNSWQFDLEEAKQFMNLSPLGIQQSVLTKEIEQLYLCDEFLFRVPEGFQINEVSPYALCVEAISSSETVPKHWAGYQVWLLKLPKNAADGASLLQSSSKKKAKQPNLVPESCQQLTDRLDIAFACENIQGYYELHPGQLNHSVYDSFISQFPNGTFLSHQKYLQSETEYLDHGFVIDNIYSLPLNYSEENGFELYWLLLFTDKSSNYRPDLDFITEIQKGFYYLPCMIEVQQGDTLFSLAQNYTGDAACSTSLKTYNAIGENQPLSKGQLLTLPEEWLLKLQPGASVYLPWVNEITDYPIIN